MLPIDQKFDTELANKLARLESYNKHLYRPNTYLHKWWARRCGTTFRLILKHLVDDDLFRDFYAPGGLSGRIVMDPMMGGGTTIHEAIRLGANAIGVDLDPIPILQIQASLSDIPLTDLSTAFQEFTTSLRVKLDRYYRTKCPYCDDEQPFRFMLYGALRECECGSSIAVDSFVLRRESNNNEIKICPQCWQISAGKHTCVSSVKNDHLPLIEKNVRICKICGEAFREDYSRPYYRRYLPLAVVGYCRKHGQFFRSPDGDDLSLINLADQERAGLIFSGDLSIQSGVKRKTLLNRGIGDYRDLFSSRQLVYLSEAIGQVANYPAPIRLHLALLVSTSLEFNSMLCGYKGVSKRRAGAIRHAFSHHGYSFPYTALENNPVFRFRSSGTLDKLFQDRVIRGKRWAKKPKERNILSSVPKYIQIDNEYDFGEMVDCQADLHQGSHKCFVLQQSATTLGIESNSVDFVVTDPPYFDSVQYSDLADFFRVWLRQMLPNEAAHGIVWDYDIGESAVGFFTSNNSKVEDDLYLRQMSSIFKECQRVLKPEKARLIFTFHHWKYEGWASLCIALKRAGFRLINHYTVHSENPISVHIKNFQALTDDAILVCAPEGMTAQAGWLQPMKIRSDKSADFCEDCSSLLGWLLNQELDEAEIWTIWEKMLSDEVQPLK